MVDNYSIPSMLYFILTLHVLEKHCEKKKRNRYERRIRFLSPQTSSHLQGGIIKILSSMCLPHLPQQKRVVVFLLWPSCSLSKYVYGSAELRLWMVRCKPEMGTDVLYPHCCYLSRGATVWWRWQKVWEHPYPYSAAGCKYLQDNSDLQESV